MTFNYSFVTLAAYVLFRQRHCSLLWLLGCSGQIDNVDPLHGIIVLAVSHCLVMVLEILKKVLRTMNKNQESFLFKTNMVAPGLLAATIASAVHPDSHMTHGPV